MPPTYSQSEHTGFVNIKGPWGQTALFWAYAHNRKEIIDILLQANADTNTQAEADTHAEAEANAPSDATAAPGTPVIPLMRLVPLMKPMLTMHEIKIIILVPQINKSLEIIYIA